MSPIHPDFVERPFGEAKLKLLIAEDDVFFQSLLCQILEPEYEIIMAEDGIRAWELLQQPDPPRLAILDWIMPGLTGPEVCRKVRACSSLSSMYLIILTAKNSTADIVSGLRAGADDYITKPPVAAALRARVRMGQRVIRLEDAVRSQSILKQETPDSKAFDVRGLGSYSAPINPWSKTDAAGPLCMPSVETKR